MTEIEEAVKVCEGYFEKPCIAITHEGDKEKFDTLAKLEKAGSYRGKLNGSTSVISIESDPGWYEEMATFCYESYNVFNGDFGKQIDLCYILTEEVYLILFDQLGYLLKEF
jgi:hypothetical protein